MQANISVMKTYIATLKENTDKLDIRLGSVEGHMTGFLSTARYHEAEINELRGRIEALEEGRNTDKA